MWPIFKCYPFVLIFSFLNVHEALGRITSSSLADEVAEEPSLRGVILDSALNLNYWVTLSSSAYLFSEFCHLQEYLSPHLVGT